MALSDKAAQKAAREASELAFFQRLAPTVPAAFCSHLEASCSSEKHQLIQVGAQGESEEIRFMRTLAMTVPTCEGLRCRCCRVVL